MSREQAPVAPACCRSTPARWHAKDFGGGAETTLLPFLTKEFKPKHLYFSDFWGWNCSLLLTAWQRGSDGWGHLSGTVSVSAHLILKHMMEYLCMWLQRCHFLSDRSYQATEGWYDVMCSVYSIFQMKALWTSPYINMHYRVHTPSLFFSFSFFSPQPPVTLRQPGTTLLVNTAQTNWREIIPALMLLNPNTR